MNRKVLSAAIVGASIIAPLVSFAQPVGTKYIPSEGLGGFITLIQTYLGYALPILISIAVLYFVWNVFQYTIKSGDEEARKKAKGNIIWGVIGLFVIVGVWGLVGILQSTFGVNSNNSAPSNINNILPTVQ